MTSTLDPARDHASFREGCLLTHPAGARSTNCLTAALSAARADHDEIVFMVPCSDEDKEGHVALREVTTGSMREAGTPAGLGEHDLISYLAEHDFRMLGVASPADLRDLVALPLPARAAAISALGGSLPAVAHRRFGIAGPIPIPPRPPAPPSGGSRTDGQDSHVDNWLNALGGSVSQSDKDALKQTADDAQTLKGWFDSHRRGDPALNDMPKTVADAENRLLSNASISQQIHVGDVVTRDGLGNFISSLDKAADSAKASFQSFQKNNKGASAGEVSAAAQASILQANLPILDAASNAGAKVDGTFGLDDLKAIAGSHDAGVADPLRKAAQTFMPSFDAFAHASGSGDGLVDAKGLGKAVSDGIGLSRQDNAVHQWVDTLGGAVSDDDRKSLTQVGDDATTLKAWFDAHSRGDPALNAMPQNIADAEKRLLGNKAVEKRITVDDGNDKGKVTRDTLGSFIDDLNKAAGDAKKSWEGFKKDNPNANPVTQRSAVNASILQANLPVLDEASDGAKLDGKIDVQDLQTYAAADSRSPLGRAATAYATDGAFSKIDTAGDDPSIPTDGIAINANFDAYLTKGTSKSADATVGSLRVDATQNAIKNAGGDASKITPDYFKDPAAFKASGADKAAAMVQLSSSLSRLHAGEAAFGTKDAPNAFGNADDFHRAYPGEKTPGEIRDGLDKDIQDKITTLSKDKDVQSFLTTSLPKQLQADVAKDPGLKESFQAEYDNTSSSKALQDAFGAKDKDGKPLTTTAALARFEQNPNFYAQALGITPDFSKAFEGAPQDIKDKIKQGYNEITSGKSMDDAVAAKISPENAMVQAVSDKTVYDAVLDKQSVEDGSNKFGDVVSARARDDLTKGLSGDDMIKGLGFSGANDPKLEQFVNDNLAQLVGPGSNPKVTADVLSGLRQLNDLMRGGAKFEDSLSKLDKTYQPKFGDTSAQYKAGVLHGVSGLFLAGAMGARLAAKGNTNAVQTAQQSLSTAGVLLEGGAKYYAKIQSDLKAQTKDDKATLDRLKAFQALPYHDPDIQEQIDKAEKKYNDSKATEASYAADPKKFENVGKVVGGVAGNALGFFSGILGSKSAAANGNTGDAAAQGLLAGLNGISATASVGEVATYLAPKWGSLSQVQADSAVAWGARLGLVGGVVGGVAAAAGLIYTIVTSVIEDLKKNRTETAWYDQVQNGLAPTGIQLPNRFDLLSPEFGYEPDDTVAD